MNEKKIMYKEYTKYLQSYFKRTIILDIPEAQIKTIFYKVNDLFVMSTCSKDFELAPRSSTKDLINHFREYVVRLLFIIPLNDKMMIGYLFRLLNEYLFRIIYSLYNEGSAEEIVIMSKRDIVEKIKDKVNCEITEKLLENYSKYSEITHGVSRRKPYSTNIFDIQNKIDNGLLKYINSGLDDLLYVFIDSIFNNMLRSCPTKIELGLKKRLRDNLNETRLSKIELEY